MPHTMLTEYVPYAGFNACHSSFIDFSTHLQSRVHLNTAPDPYERRARHRLLTVAIQYSPYSLNEAGVVVPFALSVSFVSI